MKKQLKHIKYMFCVITGILIIYSSLSFVVEGIHIQNTLSKNYSDLFLAATLLFVGYGITIGAELILNLRRSRDMIKLAVLYSVLYLLFSVFLTIQEARPGCSCATIQEYIGNIRDWSRVVFSLILLIEAYTFHTGLNYLTRRRDSLPPPTISM
jgi:hypothetical protein